MTDEVPDAPEPPVQVPEEGDVGTKPTASKRRRWKWPMILLGVFVVVPAMLFALWTWIALSWSYSEDGLRAGYVQKLSSKGWLCKTWEGELSMVNVPGAVQERWVFSVRDDSIARVITELMGNKVALEYEEHRGIPTSCFGETDYFVKGVRKVP